MPTSYVRQQAKKHGISVDKSEKNWDKAKAIASKKGKEDDFAYVTGIYKKIMGESVKDLSLSQFLALTEMNDAGDVSYGSPEDEIAPDDNLEDDNLEDDNLEDDNLEDDNLEDDNLEDDNLDPDDLAKHTGHKLTDVVGDDELDSDELDSDELDSDELDSDELDSDELDSDELDSDELDSDELDSDELSDDSQGQGRLRPSRDEYEMGESSHCNFLKDLLLITEKKKPLVKAAKSVYHRDYLKTKKKPYRKYHPEPTNEGALDYLRGMGQHVGGKIANKLADKGRQVLEPFRQAHAAGQHASQQADRQKFQRQLGQTVQQLGKLTLDIYKLSQQLHGQNNQPQQTSEGVFDYMRGAGSAVGGMAKQAGSNIAGSVNRFGQAAAQKGREIHQAGQQRSLQGQLQQMVSTKDQLMTKLVQMSKRVGPDAINKTIDQLFASKQINLAKKLKKEFLIQSRQQNIQQNPR
jgi:hypothetical protein